MSRLAGGRSRTADAFSRQEALTRRSRRARCPAHRNDQCARTVATGTFKTAYHPTTVHGLLQTADYARALYATLTGFSAEAIEQGVEAQLIRQRLLTEADPPCAWFIMDEAALHRVVGGPVTMRDHEGLAGAIVRGCQTAERHHPGHPLRGRRIFRHGKQLYYPGIYCSRGKCGVCRRTYWFHLS